MPLPSRYLVPAATIRAEREILRSRFITTVGRASTAEEAAAFVRAVSGEHPGAAHNCWAYVVGPPGDTSRIGMSDDGEPHGTAGRPMLNALLRAGVGDIVAVVTRYYGGTKLGTGGLVRAYGGGVQQALAALAVAERIDYLSLTAVVDYASLSALQQACAACEGEILRQEFAADVRVRLRLPAGRAGEFRSALLNATRGRARVAED
ncbi:MAG TPA: YigZ family protein [Vicinamibacterales bacterium]|nr:YigZ family protein [Vicinamibacterales bacterium]HOQ61956.1 YigZ family protein [Vicinamibacterales bacterium]